MKQAHIYPGNDKMFYLKMYELLYETINCTQDIYIESYCDYYQKKGRSPSG